jgi:hypothetical protein
MPNQIDVRPNLFMEIPVIRLIDPLPGKGDRGLDAVALVFQRIVRNHFGHNPSARVAGRLANPPTLVIGAGVDGLAALINDKRTIKRTKSNLSLGIYRGDAVPVVNQIRRY